MNIGLLISAYLFIGFLTYCIFRFLEYINSSTDWCVEWGQTFENFLKFAGTLIFWPLCILWTIIVVIQERIDDGIDNLRGKYNHWKHLKRKKKIEEMNSTNNDTPQIGRSV